MTMKLLQNLQSLPDITPEMMQDGLCKLEKLRCNMQALGWSQMLEYGRITHPEVLPHNFAGTPFFRSETANGATTIDFEQVIGKASTRGHIKNRGEADITISFYTMDKQWSSPYVLAPGDVFDFGSFAARRIQFSVAESVPYSLFAQ